MSDAELEAIRARDAAFTNDAPLGDWRHHEPGGGLHIASFCAADCVNDRRILLARLDAAEARERALREALALVGVAPFTLGIDGTPCYCDEDDDSHSDACAAARALLAEPTEGGS